MHMKLSNISDTKTQDECMGEIFLDQELSGEDGKRCYGHPGYNYDSYICVTQNKVILVTRTSVRELLVFFMQSKLNVINTKATQSKNFTRNIFWFSSRYSSWEGKKFFRGNCRPDLTCTVGPTTIPSAEFRAREGVAAD